MRSRAPDALNLCLGNASYHCNSYSLNMSYLQFHSHSYFPQIHFPESLEFLGLEDKHGLSVNYGLTADGWG